MEPHGQNHLTDGVLANGQHPTRQERYENTETRGTKTVPKMNLVNPERIWYVSVHLGVPPSHQFRKTGYGWNALFFQPFFHYPTIQSTQKRRNYSYDGTAKNDCGCLKGGSGNDGLIPMPRIAKAGPH